MSAPKHNVVLEANGLKFSAYSSWPQSRLNSDRPKRLIFLLHGFPDTRETWSGVWEFLVPEYPPEAGALVLAPSLRGYEETSFVEDTQYGPADIAGDVASWIRQLTAGGENIGRDTFVHIVGHDWGAIVAFKTASMYPELLTSIATLAIPYLSNMTALTIAWAAPEQAWYSSYMVRMQARLFYGSVLSQEGRTLPYIEKLWRYWSPNWDFSEEELALVSDVLRKPGIADATTAYYRCVRRTSRLGRGFGWKVDFDKVPTLLIGGETDGCMSIRLYDAQEHLLRDEAAAKVVKLPHVGHFMQRESPRKITELVVAWISGAGLNGS